MMYNIALFAIKHWQLVWKPTTTVITSTPSETMLTAALSGWETIIVPKTAKYTGRRTFRWSSLRGSAWKSALQNPSNIASTPSTTVPAKTLKSTLLNSKILRTIFRPYRGWTSEWKRSSTLLCRSVKVLNNRDQLPHEKAQLDLQASPLACQKAAVGGESQPWLCAAAEEIWGQAKTRAEQPWSRQNGKQFFFYHL